MKRLYAVGFSGLVLGAAVVGYNIQASEPTQVASQAMQDATSEPANGGSLSGVSREITVYKSPNCGCCAEWAEHLETHGFAVEMKAVDNLQAIKIENDVPREMASCHTALIDGLVVEGHVPAEDIIAYLENSKKTFNDKTVGLSVPGMPHGTPGMETGRKDSFAVLAFTADGENRVVKSYDNY